MIDQTPQSDDTAILDLSVEGMTCASCVSRVDRSLRRAEGVRDVAVNLATGRARVKIDAGVPLERLVDRVERAGYRAERYEQGVSAKNEEQEVALLRRHVAIALPLAAVVMIVAMAPMIVPGLMEVTMPWRRELDILQFILTTLLLAWPARRFFTIALSGLRHGNVDMNTLVALGTGVAWLFSAVVLLVPQLLPGVDPHNLYFDTAAVVAALVLLGRLLESRARSRTGGAIRALMALAPRVAHRLDRDDRTRIEDVEIDFVRHDDLLLVRPGEAFPVDGHVVEGRGPVDVSMMTGEPIPVDVEPEMEVIGGTVNVGGGTFTVRATGAGEETVLAGIIRAVDAAQSSRAPVQRLADRIAAIFVPVVLGLAVATFAGWMAIGDVSTAAALVPAVAVLVIACPCALGLAVPTAIIAAVGRGAERGILFRNAEALERAAAVTTVVFDKTGTLTLGRPEVVEVRTAGAIDRDRLLQLAASVESLSEHPIARGIIQHAAQRQQPLLPVDDFHATAGSGVVGRVEEQQVEVARPTVDVGKTPPGAGVVEVTVGGAVAGWIILGDTVRPESASTVAELATHNVHSVLLTGDAEAPALHIADMVGIGTVHSGVRPEEKGEVIAHLRSRGESVAMIGDGVNDAPALARSDVGIAMGGGTDVAISASDITLVGGAVDRVPEALLLARRTVRIIRQNLFWAFVYNVIGIPLAALGLLDPMIGGAAMALSSVSVVTNALRLRRG